MWLVFLHLAQQICSLIRKQNCGNCFSPSTRMFKIKLHLTLMVSVAVECCSRFALQPKSILSHKCYDFFIGFAGTLCCLVLVHWYHSRHCEMMICIWHEIEHLQNRRQRHKRECGIMVHIGFHMTPVFSIQVEQLMSLTYLCLNIWVQLCFINKLTIAHMKKACATGLEITAGQRTMSGLIVDLTGQTFVLPVILTGQNSIVLKMKLI